jgi:hypothetical protein
VTPPYVVRRATRDDVAFLVDVVVEATAAQHRWPADFDEPAWRVNYSAWTEYHVRNDLYGSETSVIELTGRRIGRLRVVRTDQFVELAGIQLMPSDQCRGIGGGDRRVAESRGGG